MTQQEFGELRVGDIIYYYTTNIDETTRLRTYWVIVEVGRQDNVDYICHRIRYIYSENPIDTQPDHIGAASDYLSWNRY